jgi:hypothetical protein
MSDNLADFLNDNAGVVTAGVGLAVDRNITATNRSLTALRSELGNLQQKFAQEQKKEARENLNRDMLFQINQQVESMASSEPSSDQYFELYRVSEELRQLGFTSATFTSLQDKSYLSAVSASIDNAIKRCLESLSEETQSLVTDAVAWSNLLKWGSSIAQLDREISQTHETEEEARRWLATLEKSEPDFFSNRRESIFGISALAIGVLLGLVGMETSSQLTMVALLFFVIGGTALIVRWAGLNSQIKEHSADVKEAQRRIGHSADHIARLRAKRSGLARQLSDLKRIPAETLEFYQSESTEHTERLNQLKEVSNYLNRVCYALGTDRCTLPGAS